MKLSEKINCSVGILTLNCGDTLGQCLESLKDFGEIIICDGNSTDNTLEIAKEYGAKIIKQYDSDEPNLRCVKDKANVRQKNMDAANYDWYFFMDADDILPTETIDEIREIVNGNSEFQIYKMPTKLIINGKIINHASWYPAYQIRLFKRSAGAKFKGKVHDHMVFDRTKHKTGMMKNYYYFIWPDERVKNFWNYQKIYTEREVDVFETNPWKNFLYWGIYLRLKIIVGFLLRMLLSYGRYGFKDRLPLRFELMVLAQHFYLLYLLILKRTGIYHEQN